MWILFLLWFLSWLLLLLIFIHYCSYSYFYLYWFYFYFFSYHYSYSYFFSLYCSTPTSSMDPTPTLYHNISPTPVSSHCFFQLLLRLQRLLQLLLLFLFYFPTIVSTPTSSPFYMTLPLERGIMVWAMWVSWKPVYY